MNEYYLLSCKSGNGPVSSAFAPKGTHLAQDLIKELDGQDSLPFKMKLAKLDVGENGLVRSDQLDGVQETWRDYQPNSLAWPLFSERLKTVIVDNLSGAEGVDWIAAKVAGPVEERLYYIPRFNRALDVLDHQRTLFVEGTDHVIRPVFSHSKVKDYHMFPKPLSHDLWRITSGLYVSQILKSAMQKAKLTGLDFEKTRLAE